MFRSTTIIRELAIEPGRSYIDIKTFSKVTSSFVMRWCGSMSQYGGCIVCCAERDSCYVFFRSENRLPVLAQGLAVRAKFHCTDR